MSGFSKRHESAAAAGRALARSAALVAAGVPTPSARPGKDPREIVFDRIDGPSGTALLGHPLPELLRPLQALNRADVPGLARYDPLRRIRPRLGAGDRVPTVLDPGPVPGGRTPIHGDFHFGQLILAPRGRVHVVDLDDMALGPPEADLGNLVAHLATSDWAGPDFDARLGHWSRAVPEAWRVIGGVCAPDRFALYLDFALLRRHLKLREAGRPDFRDAILPRLSVAAIRISPSGSAACRG